MPREGGVILARAPGRAELEEIMALDPFVRAGAARVEIVEFRTSFHHACLAEFADPGTRVVAGAPPG